MIHVRTSDRVTIITLNRPEKRNALDTQGCVDLAAAAVDAVHGGARAIVFAGNGPAFCSGADLRTVEDEEFVPTLYRTLDAIATLPVATLAAVQGPALGGGLQLAIACDLRIVAPDVRFGIPAAKLGLMVNHWTVQRLAQLAGHGPATAVLVACEELDAETSLRCGLANRIGDLDDALRWAGEISAMAPLTIAGHKLALDSTHGLGADGAVETAFRKAWASADLAEGQRARTEKRAPQFEGR